tara:strand:+ start:440 stop:763 length:324 start_codon:yes stop_codon:yes gene_type:complete
MARYFNITGASAAAAVLTRELLKPGGEIKVNRISFANIHATHPCSVDLYIEKESTGKFYFLKGVKLPIGATLNYSVPEFSNRPRQYGLYMKLNASASETPSVDVTLY